MKVSKDYYFWISHMNFGKFGQTTYGWKECVRIVYETFRLLQINAVLWLQCDVPYHTTIDHICGLHDAKRVFGRRRMHGTLNLSFCMRFLKISNKIGRASWKHHLMVCDYAPLCQIIWGHLNNSRWINGPQESS